MGQPDFWADRQASQEVVARLSGAKGTIQRLRQLTTRLGDVEVWSELAREENDQNLGAEAAEELSKLAEDVDRFRLELLLRGQYDRGSMLLTLHAGAGGIEAQDWVEMLLRMYTRWAQLRGYEVELLDSLEGEEAGLKSATIAVRGDNAYGFGRTERGVHRLVRISPFDAQNRRHTTFASLDVTPDVAEVGALDVPDDELRVETFRASGRGGQHVNKTDSAVRITHLPTGITASCQNERSQHANRATAMRILTSRIVKLREQEREELLAAEKGVLREIAWGNQIRSYVFHPYSLVKDHRTGLETGNVQSVMDGNIDSFIFAFLKQQAISARNPEGRESPQSSQK
jgi:peptide chain release factor 2